MEPVVMSATATRPESAGRRHGEFVGPSRWSATDGRRNHL